MGLVSQSYVCESLTRAGGFDDSIPVKNKSRPYIANEERDLKYARSHLSPTSQAIDSKSKTLNDEPQTISPKHKTPNLKGLNHQTINILETLHSIPYTLSPKFQSLDS